jgi:hypothetical protein
LSLRDRVRGIFDRGEVVSVDRKEEFARFAIFWMVLSLAAYAYLGEKVPWLILTSSCRWSLSGSTR